MVIGLGINICKRVAVWNRVDKCTCAAVTFQIGKTNLVELGVMWKYYPSCLSYAFSDRVLTEHVGKILVRDFPDRKVLRTALQYSPVMANF